MSEETRLSIQQALLSPQGQEAMAVLRDRYANGELLVAAKEEDYTVVSGVLNDSYPFYNPFGKSFNDAYRVQANTR
jgi:hypothetical protein